MSFKLELSPMSLSGDKSIPLPEGITPASIYIDYVVNEIPKIKLVLSIFGKANIYDLKYYTCTATLADGDKDSKFNSDFDFYVEHINVTNSSTTVLSGLMCNYEQATLYKSVSLGNTISEAISSLGFERKIQSFDKPAINFNYLQFNETANDALLKILIGNSRYSYGYLTDKAIGTRNFSELKNSDESTRFSHTVSNSSILYIGNPYSVETTEKDYEIEFSSSTGNSKVKYDLHQSSINGNSIIYHEIAPQELNALCNRKFMGTLNNCLEFTSSSPIPGNPNIGDILFCKNYNELKDKSDDAGFNAIITRHTIYESSNGNSSYYYRFERT